MTDVVITLQVFPRHTLTVYIGNISVHIQIFVDIVFLSYRSFTIMERVSEQFEGICVAPEGPDNVIPVEERLWVRTLRSPIRKRLLKLRDRP